MAPTAKWPSFSIKKRLEIALRGYPALFALGSRLYHGLHRSFASLSPGAPAAIHEALQRAAQTREDDLGDYYEFGLFRGYTLFSAFQSAGVLGLRDLRFYGFDSFEGLPPVVGVDRASEEFFEGQFACSKQQVMRNLSKRGVDWSRVTLIEGFFSASLTPELKRRHPFRRVAVAFIDCDLYASTAAVLSWLTDLLDENSILLFDDWHCFDARADRGQQRAFAEFLQANPWITPVPLYDFEDHGRAFLLRCG
jgi:O-methyltransferase